MTVAEKDTLDIWVNGQRVPTTVRCFWNVSFEIFQAYDSFVVLQVAGNLSDKLDISVSQ